MTYTFGGKFVKWTAGLIWESDACSMCLNSFGAWIVGFPMEMHSLSYNHKEGKHFLKIFRHSAIQIGERH